MKIVSDDNTFIIPLSESNRIILVSSNYKQELIDCFYSYFVMKKKTRCVIYDDDNQIINQEDINFIFIPDDTSYENNFNLKTKTIMNIEMAELINNNQDFFLSLEKIRKELLNVSTDKGMFRLRRILSNGLNKTIDFEFKEFNINLFLQFFSIDYSSYSESEKQIILFNILLYVNRNKINIVYLNIDIDETTLKWIEKYENTIFIIDNDVVYSAPNGFDMLILSNNNHLITTTESNQNIKLLSYMNHKIVKTNISLQNEKNVELFNSFNDFNSTFFIKNNY